MPRLRLPPLPPGPAWGQTFSRRHFPSPHCAHNRETLGRQLLASRALAGAFVRALGVREGEVVLELYAGAGALTRALLAGGRDETAAVDWAGVGAQVGPIELAVKEAGRKKKAENATTFPPWAEFAEPDEPDGARGGADVVRPRLVVATDPSVGLLVRGLGMPMPESAARPKRALARMFDSAPAASTDAAAPAAAPAAPAGPVVEDSTIAVVDSPLEPALKLAAVSPYPWTTVPRLLSHPAVYPALERCSAAPGVEGTKRAWDAPAPLVTVVAQMQDSTMGEQMVSQWIGCAAGSARGRSWLWQWGRVRLALLVGKGTFDRLIAGPGDKHYCKLSVMANALFHVSPLPPHSPTPAASEPRAGAQRPLPVRPSGHLPSKPSAATPTSTFDFFPAPYGAHDDAPLARPSLVGVLLEPRLASPVRAEQKDVWDFVLRKCFVRETATLAEALPQVDFGAANLLPACEAAGSAHAGERVDGRQRVRDLTVEQWARVVDVFDKWPFRPEHLILDTFTSEVRQPGGMD